MTASKSDLRRNRKRLSTAAGLLGQAVAALAAAALDDVRPPARAHAAQEPVHAAAVSLLGLERALHRSAVVYRSRASRPVLDRAHAHSTSITSSHFQTGLRPPQACATIRARKHSQHALAIISVQISHRNTVLIMCVR